MTDLKILAIIIGVFLVGVGAGYHQGQQKAFVTCSDPEYISIHVNASYVDCYYAVVPVQSATRRVRI